MTGNPEAHDYAAWAKESYDYKQNLRNMTLAEFQNAKASAVEVWQIEVYRQVAAERASGVTFSPDGVMGHPV